MNKAQLWAKVQEAIEATEFKSKKSKEEFYSHMAELLEPKRGGGASTRTIKEVDGTIYKSCRLTGRLWPESELVYQNEKAKEEGKDKGYSKVGISLWNKGQKFIRDLETKLVDATINGEDPTELAYDLKKIKSEKLGNSPEWIKQFATEEQLKEIEEKSLPID